MKGYCSGPCAEAGDYTPLHAQHPTSLPISAVLKRPPIYADATRVILAFRIFRLKVRLSTAWNDSASAGHIYIILYHRYFSQICQENSSLIKI